MAAVNACKICGSETAKIFAKTVLGKYAVDYFKCTRCEFIQTSDVTWLKEAYSNAITALDIGLPGRNVGLAEETARLIDACFPNAKTFIDYAGGYGLFVRLMRDKGFDFYRQDIYCENIFAKNFDVSDSPMTKFDVLTAFEVFEHFNEPMTEIADILKFSSNIIFSTSETDGVSDLENWWYIAPETGQHIAFYSRKTLQFIAERLATNYYHNGGNLHIFTREKLSPDQFEYSCRGAFVRSRFKGLIRNKVDFKKEREGLLQPDFERVKALLKKMPDA